MTEDKFIEKKLALRKKEEFSEKAIWTGKKRSCYKALALYGGLWGLDGQISNVTSHSISEKCRVRCWGHCQKFNLDRSVK